jgi:DNA invertase Pin-like site-specific DNA recombinase
MQSASFSARVLRSSMAKLLRSPRVPIETAERRPKQDGGLHPPHACWKLDRLSRSLKDVLHIMDRIAQAGAGFQSITENIDTTTLAGRMMMQMIGSFAEFERAMIRERTSAGIAAARAEGRVGGRRKKLDTAKGREIAESVVSGRKSGAEMARLYNVSQPTVSRIVAEFRTDLT